MAIIRIKRSTLALAPSSLSTAELAYTMGTGTASNGGDRLYFGKGDDGSGNATSIVVIGGEYFVNMLDHTPGTLTASSAIITDSANKIDQLNIDNLTINGNTISAQNTDGSIFIHPDGAGTVDVDNHRITNVTDPTGAQDAATKNYVDGLIGGGAAAFRITADVGLDSDEIATGGLVRIVGDSDILTTLANNEITISHRSSDVSPGTYGSATEIPVITVNSNGHVDAISTASVATVLNVSTDSGSGVSIDLLDSNLTLSSGEGINVYQSNGTTIVIQAEEASDINKGVASFDNTDFTVTDGNVVVNAITLGTTSLNPGETDSSLDGLSAIGVGDILIGGAPGNNVISSKSGGFLYIDPNPTGDSAGGYGGSLVIRGNLTVQGTTTTVNSTTVSINDVNLVLADSAADAAAADGAGITIGGASYSGTKATITYDGANDRWDFNKPLDISYNTLDSAVFLGGVGLGERIEDHLSNFFLEGEGIDITYNDGAGSMTFSAEVATAAYTAGGANLGVASFNDSDFTVTSGYVRIDTVDGGTF